MIYSTEIVEIEDAAMKLATAILTSSQAEKYQSATADMQKSAEAKEKQADFLQAKQSFDKIAEYGVHAPDYRERQIALRRAKRHLDMVEPVMHLRQSETDLQDILDQVTAQVAGLVSKEIIVDYGNAFFHAKKHHHHDGCQGGCQSVS